jgi:hypothetical protein
MGLLLPMTKLGGWIDWQEHWRKNC